ncbi:MAG: aquaporin [Bacteroidales bacterium]|nr:aquaporin [Bacteroidales bacterium]
MKKYLAEMMGTFVLTLLGCGAAVSLACGSNTASVVGTALAFGIALSAMVYTIGGISGCHINPAVTLACLLTDRISGREAFMYMLYQVLGGIAAAAVLYAITSMDASQAGGTLTGANHCGSHGVITGLVVEAVLTTLFVMVVLGATHPKVGAGKFAGLAVGLALTLVHLTGIHYTGTGVNPARSIGPAIFEGGQALSELWVFVVGPLIGAFVAAVLWKIIEPRDEE